MDLWGERGGMKRDPAGVILSAFGGEGLWMVCFSWSGILKGSQMAGFEVSFLMSTVFAEELNGF
ncbi:hypothetical protein LCL96_14965 [Rossellomorea aquimaris]|uniref:hypothetical protein n=1 Tax=Rossellomorea aquimaris TaxID=189382 RepID=UPI001CD5CB37|nr:hypothetical protein [Rossellomorea aquimaris]MCA1060237.1 hypothetical protein [Rossellomorea aquimaris]